VKLSIFVALSENGVIGRGGRLPWQLPDELQYLKQTTMGHCLLMGRKTYDSIGKPLPGRTSIVMSRNRSYQPHPDVVVVTDLESGINAASERGETELFVFGGESVYAEALGKADRLYLTRVHTELEGDAHFPSIDPSDWKKVGEQTHAQDSRHAYAFTHQTFDRVR
jgi:dihydrofolate reductase